MHTDVWVYKYMRLLEAGKMKVQQTGMIVMVLLALVLVAMPSARAERATATEMEYVAQNWVTEMAQKKGTWDGSANPVITGVHEIRQDGTLLARYYDIAPRGFVVVPVLKAMNPVKVYSDASNLDESQEGGMLQFLRDVLSSRMDMYRAAYGDLDAVQPQAAAAAFDPGQRAGWDRLAVPSREFHVDASLSSIEEAGPLLTSSWHQRAPYWNDVPMGDGGQCVVGCTATSLSQILDYWEWPVNGIGSHSYYWGGDDCDGGFVPGQTLVADFSDEYDWANIPDSCDGVVPCTPEQEAALAELCHEAGVAVEMGYSACGSGANMNMSAFVDFFKYSTAISREYRIDHTQQSWFDVIQAEIDAGRVMWYHIHSHAIVCDGYRDQGGGQLECHINYGWGQENNAWYVLDNLYCGWVEGDICPYEMEDVTINITPQYDPAMFLVGQACTETVGNGNQLFEPGETVEVTVTVENLGNIATNATGTLVSLHPDVSVSSASTTFDASFGWGEQSVALTPFVVDVGSECDEPTYVTMQLEVAADGDYLTTETFLLLVGNDPGFTDDAESGEGYWVHEPMTLTYGDQWHLETYRAHTGTYSWKMGGPGPANHSDEVDAALITPPFVLGDDASLTFWHWMQAEDDLDMTAWDGGIVMISTGNGVWTQVHPVGGYPYTIIDNPASPFAAATPCYSGSFDWTQAVFDLSAYSGVAQLMFRFGADAAMNFEGWYVDDITVTGTTPTCCVGRVGDVNVAGGDEPTIGDVSVLIDALFVSMNWALIPCVAEADINQSGGVEPDTSDLTIGDVSYLIDYLFITGESLGLPDCL